MNENAAITNGGKSSVFDDFASMLLPAIETVNELGSQALGLNRMQENFLRRRELRGQLTRFEARLQRMEQSMEERVGDVR